MATELPDPLASRLIYELPERLTDVNHWHKHTPFAFFLVELLRPARIVELGTWKGDSYCCICQAVATLGIEARATAVDLWAVTGRRGSTGQRCSRSCVSSTTRASGGSRSSS